MKSLPLVTLAVLALAGCVNPPPATRVAPQASVTAVSGLPVAASATQREGVAIERWWTVFGDDVLARLMRVALAGNEDLEAALARVRQAQSELDLARAAAAPTLDLQARAGRARQTQAGALPIPAGVRPAAPSHRLVMEAGYELDLWGRLSAGTAAARQQLLATEWARSAVEWGLTARLAQTYFELAAVERQIEISEAVRAGRLAMVRLRETELAGGAGNEFDLRRAESEWMATNSTLTGLARQRTALLRSLTALLGRAPDALLAELPPGVRLDENAAHQTVLPKGSAADLLARRPDIREAEAQLAAGNFNIEAARTAALPAVRLSGNVGTDARAMSDLFSARSLIWSLFANVTQAVLDGGRVDARVRGEVARTEASLAHYRKTVAGAVLDVREAYETLDLTDEAFKVEHNRVAALARARELALLGFQGGALGYLDLLDAERNLHQAQLQKVGAHRDRLVAQVLAFRALGGGYTAPAIAPSKGDQP